VKKLFIFILLFSINSWAVDSQSTGKAPFSAREVMQKVDDTARASSASSFSVMNLSTCKYGKKNHKIRCVEKARMKKIESVQISAGNNNKDSKSVSIVLEPASEKGIGMLSYAYDEKNKDTQTWLYLSALGKVKRMAAGSEDDAEPSSLFGSEFTTEDMENGKLSEYEYTILKEIKYQRRPVWLIEATPIPARSKKTRYSKTKLWIDKERFIVLKSQTYDKQGNAYKRLAARKIKKIDGVWMAHSLVMMNLKTKRLSNMKMSNIQLNINVPEAFLTQRTLTDFAFRESELKKLRQQIK
jgi:hypothetical protein